MKEAEKYNIFNSSAHVLQSGQIMVNLCKVMHACGH